MFLLLTLSIICCSCATIFTGSKKRVVFDSDVKQPTILTIDGRKINQITLPYTVRIKGGFNETIVKAETDGYEPTMLMVNKTFNAVSVINLGNLLGWGIDAATGAMTKPEFKFYQLEFTPKPIDPTQK